MEPSDGGPGAPTPGPQPQDASASPGVQSASNHLTLGRVTVGPHVFEVRQEMRFVAPPAGALFDRPQPVFGPPRFLVDDVEVAVDVFTSLYSAALDDLKADAMKGACPTCGRPL